MAATGGGMMGEDEQPGASYGPNDRVRHSTFGAGTVIRCAFQGDKEFAAVRFDSGERKSIGTWALAPHDGSNVVSLPIRPELRRRNVPKLDLVAASSFAGKPVPARKWHVNGLIPAHDITSLYGDGGTGKSLLALQLAVATAVGSSWLGVPAAAGTALFLTAEDTIDELHRRLFDIASAEGIDLAATGNLHLVSLAGKDALLATQDRKDGTMKATPLFDAVRAQVSRHKPTLVILDTLADLFSGDQLRTELARQFIGMLRGVALDYATTIMLLAHPSQAGMASGTGQSGNVAWSNSVRQRLYFRRIVDRESGTEHDPDSRSLQVMKSNYGRIGDEMELRWERGAFVRQRRSDELDGEDRAERARRVFVELVLLLERQSRHVSPNRSASYAPVVFARTPEARGLTKQDLETAMEQLLKSGAVQVADHGPPYRMTKKLVVPT